MKFHQRITTFEAARRAGVNHTPGEREAAWYARNLASVGQDRRAGAIYHGATPRVNHVNTDSTRRLR